MILPAAAAVLSLCHVMRPPKVLPELSDMAICARFTGARGNLEVRLARNGVASARLVRDDRIVAETSLAVSDREFRTADIDQLAADLAAATKKSY